MTRRVFDNHQTAHVWAAQTQESGRSHNGNLFFEGQTLFSYGHHFPLGIACQIDGKPVFFLNSDSYSVSTSRHQSYARNATHGDSYYLPGLAQIYTVLQADFGEQWGATRAEKIKEATARLVLHFSKPHREGSRPDLQAMECAFRVVGLNARNAQAKARACWRKSARSWKAKLERQAKARLARDLQESKHAAAKPVSDFEKEAMRILGKTGWARTLSDNVKEVRDITARLFRIKKVAKKQGWTRIAGKLETRRRAMLALIKDAQRVQAIANRRGESRRDVALIRQALDPDSPIQPAANTETIRQKALADRYKGAMFACESLLATPYARVAGAVPYLEFLQSVFKGKHKTQAAKWRALFEAENRETLKAWRAGELGVLPYELRKANGGALLRAVKVTRDESGQITGGELQTSQMASVPLTHAIRAFRFLKKCRETGQAWAANGHTIRVGHFRIDSIDSSGNMVAGCHNINWQEVQRLADDLGIAGLESDDSALAPSSNAA